MNQFDLRQNNKRAVQRQGVIALIEAICIAARVRLKREGIAAKTKRPLTKAQNFEFEQLHKDEQSRRDRASDLE